MGKQGKLHRLQLILCLQRTCPWVRSEVCSRAEGLKLSSGAIQRQFSGGNPLLDAASAWLCMAWRRLGDFLQAAGKQELSVCVHQSTTEL